MEDDDKPKVITFKELKKKKLHLTDQLKEAYEEGLQAIKSQKRRANDPRFDPRVNGICHLDDWKFLEEERTQTIQKLKSMLKKNPSPQCREKITKALNLLKQRAATEKDIKFRRQLMKDIQKEQIEKLESGQRVKFHRRSELKQLIQSKRLEKMNKKQRERYLNRKKIAKPHSVD